MNKSIVLLMAVLVVSSAIASAQLFGREPISQFTDTRSVSAQGTYSVHVKPDKAQFTAQVETEAKTAEEAVRQNRDSMAKVIAALKAAGVAEKDINTEGYYVYKKEVPVFDDPAASYPRPVKTEVVGWVATNSVRVTTTNLDATGSLIDAAATAGATGFAGVSFSLSEEKRKQVESELLKGAALDAKAKAETLAGALGAKLGSPLSVSESAPIAYPTLAKNVLAQADSSFEPGQVETSVVVVASFELI